MFGFRNGGSFVSVFSLLHVCSVGFAKGSWILACATRVFVDCGIP